MRAERLVLGGWREGVDGWESVRENAVIGVGVERRGGSNDRLSRVFELSCFSEMLLRNSMLWLSRIAKEGTCMS